MTREEAITILKDISWQMGSVKRWDNIEAIDMAIEALSDEAEWIPCSEKLPREDGRYLVFYEGTMIGSRIEIMWYCEPSMPNVDVSGKHFFRSDDEWGDIIYDEVIAWMPLPTPYKGGDTE